MFCRLCLFFVLHLEQVLDQQRGNADQKPSIKVCYELPWTDGLMKWPLILLLRRS